jgi:hypothetical protein
MKMSAMRCLSFAPALAICVVFPSTVFANVYPYEAQFCTAEDGNGDCTSWTNALSSSDDFLPTFETCKDTSMSCVVWFICSPYQISDIHQVALWTYNNHATGDIYSSNAAYWDVDSGGGWVDYGDGLDHYNYHANYLYHAWEWDDLSNYTDWDYPQERPVMRQEFCYGTTSSCTHAAIEVWMGNSTDC